MTLRRTAAVSELGAPSERLRPALCSRRHLGVGLITVGLAATLSTSAATQERARLPATRDRDLFSERIEVTEVLLDVLVTDKSGEVVTGLEPEDFVIEERDEVLRPTDVVFYGGAEQLGGSGVEGEARSDRYFILVFHDQKRGAPFLTGPQLDAGRWTKKWIESALLPNDQVAVMGYDARLKLFQDFTCDPKLLQRAVDAAVIGKREPDRERTVSAPRFDLDSPSIDINLPVGKELSRSTRRIEEALALI
ncbi:MAG: hypothetical protein VYE73_17750, partial [Acidobacteriota bacterium]|nr:hypothetical protein [Acidobacteriota bacterium]